MINETVMLSPDYPKATLTTYLYDDNPDMKHGPRRAVVVCPGGGYHFLSEREAEPIVMQFLAAGFNCFLLRYSVAPDTHNYEPLTEAARAIAHIRRNAGRYNVIPDKIFITGFSAGGHLAASAGILWNSPVLQKEFAGEPERINRPDGMILSYPVITAGEFAHKNSIRSLTGNPEYGADLEAEWSLELHVDDTTPPAFIWHTQSDKSVPIQNSLMLASAFAAKKIPFELHIFPEGPHGLSLATEDTANGNPAHVVPHVQCWINLAIAWVKLQ